MRKLKTILAGAFLLCFCASCSITYHQVNSNPIGDKVGESSGLDYSFRTAVQKGDIEKISTTKVVYSAFGTPTTTVGGE